MKDKEKSILKAMDMQITVFYAKIEAMMNEWRTLRKNADKHISALYEEDKQNENWIPNVGETYYSLDIICQIDKDVWRNHMFERFRCYRGNCFKTYEEAVEYRNKFMDEAELEMKRKDGEK